MRSEHATDEVPAPAPEQGIMIQDASAWVLRIGVITSVVVMLVGIAISFLHHSVTVQHMQKAPVDDNLKNLWIGLRTFRGHAVIELGIFLLVLTPILRVVTSMVLFCVEERDWLYTVVTFLVLALTLAGLFLLK